MPNTHIPFDPTLYTGRAEPFEPATAQYWYQHITAFEPTTQQKIAPKIALVGFASEQGVLRNQGRVGAKSAPPAIRQIFGKMPISLAVQKKFANNINALIGDMGDVVCHDDGKIVQGSLENAQQQYADAIAQAVANQSIAIGLGGGHEIAFGSFLGLYQGLSQGLEKSHDPTNLPKIGILNFDAHFDIRQDQYATSGTPFRQIAEFLSDKNLPFHYFCVGISQFNNTGALFERAETLGVEWISDDDCYRLEWQVIEQRLQAFLAKIDVLYVTIDMDCLPAGVMPAVSAVAAKGIPLDFVERCLAALIDSGKVKLLDIAEVNPQYDRDGAGLKVTARLLAGIVERLLDVDNK